MKYILKKYAIPFIVGVIVTGGLIHTKDDFTSLNEWMIGVTICVGYMVGLISMALSEHLRGK